MFSAIDGYGISLLDNRTITADDGSLPIRAPVTFGPAGLTVRVFNVQFMYEYEQVAGLSAEQLHIARFENGQWRPLPSKVDEDTRTVSAFTDRMGTFRLQWSEQPDINIPVQYILEHNYPNPFNSRTVIPFSLKNDVFTELRIYDVLGREIRTLRSEFLPAGYYITIWNGTDSSGRVVPSGVYYYRLQAGSHSETKKMVFIK